jgi:hypothetical protein
MREINNNIFKRYYEEVNSKRITSTKPHVFIKGSEQYIQKALSTKLRIYEKLQSLTQNQNKSLYKSFISEYNNMHRPDKYRYVQYKEIPKQNRSAIRNPDEIRSEYAQRPVRKIDSSELAHLSPYTRSAFETKTRTSVFSPTNDKRSMSFDTTGVTNFVPITPKQDYSYVSNQNPVTFPAINPGSLTTDQNMERNYTTAGKEQIERSVNMLTNASSSTKRYSSVIKEREIKTEISQVRMNQHKQYEKQVEGMMKKRRKKKLMVEGTHIGSFAKNYEKSRPTPPEELAPDKEAKTEKNTLVT